MTCQCGDVMTCDAASREEAVSQLQATMTEDAISAHMAQKHPGEAVPAAAQIHGMIEQNVMLA